jgi:hypothetical protein
MSHVKEETFSFDFHNCLKIKFIIKLEMKFSFNIYIFFLNGKFSFNINTHFSNYTFKLNPKY